MLTGPMTKRRSNAKTAYGLMTDIRAYILEEPKRVYMGDWIIRGKKAIELKFETEAPVCGTVGCIAGNAMVLRGRLMTSRVGAEAARLISGGDKLIEEKLWDLFLGAKVNAEYGSSKYARIVAARITRLQRRFKTKLQRVKLAA